MVSKHMFNRIRELAEKGMSIRAIERELKINRKTISKYLLSNAPPSYKTRAAPTRADPCDLHKDRIESLIAAIPGILACDIFVVLKEEGYAGSLRTLERRVATIKGQRPKERFFEQSYTPGEQAQFDFKESLQISFVDGKRLTHLHFGTLPYSGYFAIKAFGHRTYEAFAEGLHSFFESAGGMTEKIRFDNLAPCVKKVLKGNERIYTDKFQKAIDYYGFKPLPCRPGKGSDKGDVEREIRTQARRIEQKIERTGRVFQDYEDMNNWLKEFRDEYSTPKIRELHAEEKLHLTPLPPRDIDVLCQIETATATKHGTVKHRRSIYSVPDQLIDVNCRVVIDAYQVHISRVGHGHKAIAVHPRKENGEHSILLQHVLPSLVRKPGAMVRWAHRELLFPSKVFRQYFNWLGKLYPGAVEREYLKSINLIQYASLEDIGLAMEVICKNKSTNPFDDLKVLLMLSVVDQKPALAQKPIQIKLSVYDSLIPDNQEFSA